MSERTVVADGADTFTNGKLFRIQSCVDGNFLTRTSNNIPGLADSANRFYLAARPETGEENQQWRADIDGAGFKVTCNDGSAHCLANHGFIFAISFPYAEAEWSKWVTVHYGGGALEIRNTSGGRVTMLSNPGSEGNITLVANPSHATKWRLVQADNDPYIIRG